MGWTDERVEALKKLWLEGHSASQIAKQLGGVTRNAVIGKVHRMGLSGRAAPSQPARPVLKPQRPARPVTASLPQTPRRIEAATHHAVSNVPVPPTPLVERHEAPGTATVLTLGACMCKWPIGEPGTDSFTFCGGRATKGVYCSTHADLAYQPQVKKAGARSGANELARSLRRYI